MRGVFFNLSACLKFAPTGFLRQHFGTHMGLPATYASTEQFKDCAQLPIICHACKAT